MLVDTIEEISQREVRTPCWDVFFSYFYEHDYSLISCFLAQTIKLSGCRLLSYLHKTVHQAPDIQKPFSLLLGECLHVFLQQVSDWIAYGTLSDDHGDFLVHRVFDVSWFLFCFLSLIK